MAEVGNPPAAKTAIHHVRCPRLSGSAFPYSHALSPTVRCSYQDRFR